MPPSRRSNASPEPIDAHDVPEVTCSAGLDATQLVVDDDGLLRGDTQRPRGGKKRVRRGLALEVLGVGERAVDPDVAELGDPGGEERFAAVRAGGDHADPETSVAGGSQIAHGPLVCLQLLPLQNV